MSKRVDDLLNEMTLDEKIGQMSKLFTDVVLNHETNNEYRKTINLEDEKVFNLGSLTGITGAENAREIQRMYLEKSRLKIPVFFMADVIHGYQIQYPNAIALGCAFDDKMVYELSKVSGLEAAVNGINVTYSPMADMTNDPRWGRIMEIPSEDVFLSENYLKAIVEGFQQDLDLTKGAIGTCVKHIAGYGLAQGGRDYDTADVSRVMFYNKYLPLYKAAIDAGCLMAMTSFNVFDMIPSTINKELLDEIIRKDAGFDGLMISDHSSIPQAVNHGVVKDEKEAALRAVEAGVDIELATTAYLENLKELVAEGKLDEELINRSVRKVLETKEKLGLFDNPYGAIDEKLAKELVEDENTLQLVKEAAIKSMVLLKNDNQLLPIKKDEEVIVLGSHLNVLELNGFNGCAQKIEQNETIKQVFENDFTNAKFIDGVKYDNNTDEDIKQIVEQVGKGNKVIMTMGEFFRWSGEGVCHAHINIDKTQEKLIKEIAKNNKVILVLFSGRPLDLTNIIDDVDSLIMAWFGGTKTASAISELVSGDANPSAKLSFTMPRSVGQIPIYYNKLNTGRPVTREHAEYEASYRDEKVSPLFEFGYGLSYSKYEYSNVQLSSDKISDNEKITISVDVQNVSDIDGTEIVQMYIKDDFASISRPIKELKGYKRVDLKASEKKTVTFEITPEMFEFYNTKLKRVKEKGTFTVFIGKSSNDVESTQIEYI